ncbi:hypothetical protein F4818DRAFT_133351 [Hypoxylon cercidicola]|nr:hypothetical protein F4818DRAFT_133351 [Hypoxylon cercidicola]
MVEKASQKSGAQDVALIGDVSIGPGGRDPSIALPRIQHFLVDEDSYRHPGWQYRLEAVSRYLEEADKARLRGDLGYDSPYVIALLEDVRILVQVHLNFDKWKNAPSRWSSDIVPTPRTSRRLPPLPDQPIPPPPNKKRNRRKWIDLGASPKARPAVFPKLSLLFAKGQSEADQYRADEELYFEGIRGLDTSKVDSSNRFLLENNQFESCIKGGIGHTCTTQPPQPVGGIADKEYYQARGWQRAAIQQSLNMLTNHENRVTNTPWRRVVLPFKEPVPMPKEIVYHARALPPDRITEDLKEPFPWFYWYNQYWQLRDTMAGWERRRYNINNWNDFRRSALPMNFEGPYTYNGLSIYDDHWLKIGAYLRRLRALMYDAANQAPRAFLLAILRDIEAGLNWQPDQIPSNRDERLDIMRRGKIDEVDGEGSDAVLIDEADAAWLRFLCEPSCSRDMCDPTKQVEDNLAILFQTRLEEFFNDTAVCDVSKIPGDIFNVDLEKWAVDYFSVSTPIEDALAYINGGPGASDSQGNETYQFTLEEARDHILRLGELGRCVYKLGDGKVVSVTRPPYNLHPEHRVRWRHKNRAEFTASQREYREILIDYLMDAHDISGTITGSGEEEISNVLDHLNVSPQLVARLKQARGTIDPERVSMGLLRSRIYPEHKWVPGAYAGGSIEEQRQAPSWSDLMDWYTVGATAEPSFQKTGDFQVPEKTVQFFRNLAYRMGRTLGHVRSIERRLQHSVPAAVTPGAPQPAGETGLWKAISQETLLEGIRHWALSINYGAGEVEFMPPAIEYVIEKADPDGTVEFELKNREIDTTWLQGEKVDNLEAWRPAIIGETIVREGIIKDSVMNRNTLYPGRFMDFEDSSGYFKSSTKFKSNKLFAATTRPSLFKWATKAQRRYQAPYVRGAFFSMQRWPLFHQRGERQDFIKRRVDEIPRVNPSLDSQRFGILMPRLPSRVREGTKETIPVPPETNGTRDPSATKATGAPASGPLVLQTSTLPPNIASIMTTNMLDPKRVPQKATKRLIPITREKSRWLPGPALFPMAETLLQQIALGQTLTKMIYPEPEPKWYEKIANLYNSVTTLPEKRVPLMPPAAEWEVPRSNPKKRKIPADFILDADKMPGKKVHRPVKTTQPTKTTEPAKPTQPAQPARPTQSAQPAQPAQAPVQKTINDVTWVGLARPEPKLGGAIRALVASAAVQYPDVQFPSAAQLEMSSTAAVDGENNWQMDLYNLNEALQKLTGPGTVFPARSYHLCAILFDDTTKQQGSSVIPTNRTDPQGLERQWIWVYVRTDQNTYTGVNFNPQPQVSLQAPVSDKDKKV